MKNKQVYISVVSPVYGCEQCLHQLHERLKISLAKISEDYEIILVNDSSPDNAWKTIEELCNSDSRVKGINLSRNFGQHAAITAGIESAEGEWVVVMDCDLQDQPEEIIKLHTKAMEGFDVVLAKRINRKDSYFKKKVSVVFYKVLSYMTDTKQDSTVANFGIYHQKVIRAINLMQDSIRFFPAMVKWVGFKITSIEIIHAERSIGDTSYNFKKLLKLAIDTTMSFSDKPLRLTIKAGLFISMMSLVFALYNLYQYSQGVILVTGWTSLIISVWFLSGLIIAFIGIVGLYVGKIFEKVKNRPMYIVNHKINFE